MLQERLVLQLQGGFGVSVMGTDSVRVSVRVTERGSCNSYRKGQY